MKGFVKKGRTVSFIIVLKFVITMAKEKIAKSKITIHFQLAAILKRF